MSLPSRIIGKMTLKTVMPKKKVMMASAAVFALAACDSPIDFDLRPERISTAAAARQATERRPAPDNRGVISYPNYQVAVARRGDTLSDVANRVGLPPASLASFNGVDAASPLRSGEIIALPQRVAEPSPATGAPATGPIQPSQIDVTTLAGNAINNAPTTTPAQPGNANATASGAEPVRHQVRRGETAFTVARLYQVPVQSLAEWNGLGSDFAIREGQFLLIPTARQSQAAAAPPEPVTAPGQGSQTPTPPSASQPLPEDDTEAVAAPVTVDAGPTTAASQPVAAAMIAPVDGSIIRAYKKGRNEGIDIKGTPGAPVRAAADGSVAAITESSEGIPIVVVRHPDNLLTVYANVTEVGVKKGDTVSRGQSLAKLRDGSNSFVHFEVRDGFDSVDPGNFLQ